MDEQMFCFQCEQAAGCTACTGAAGVCGKSAETAAAQDRLTGALIAFAGQLIAAGRGPTPEQARLLMQGLFTTITNVNFDPAAVDALTRRVHDASPGTGPDYDMQALWREPDTDRRSLKCFVLFSLRGMAAYNYHARVLGRIDPELDRFFCTALQAVGDPGQTTGRPVAAGAGHRRSQLPLHGAAGRGQHRRVWRSGTGAGAPDH